MVIDCSIRVYRSRLVHRYYILQTGYSIYGWLGTVPVGVAPDPGQSKSNCGFLILGLMWVVKFNLMI